MLVVIFPEGVKFIFGIKRMVKIKRNKKTPNKRVPKSLPQVRQKLREMLRNRIQMYPGMYQPSPISNQYYQQRDKNDSVQNQMDIAKKAFEEEKARSKTLAEQKEQLERELRDAKQDAEFQNKLHKQKSKMIADIESTRSRADELRTKNEQLQITDDLSQLNHELQTEQAMRKELEHRR